MTDGLPILSQDPVLWWWFDGDNPLQEDTDDD